MIKKYNQFIEESFNQETHHSLGEYIEQLAQNDEYIQMIVSQITDKIEPHIRLSNAVNLLDDLSKVELLKRVENYLNGIEGSTDVSATVDINSLEKEVALNIVLSFTKSETDLNEREIMLFQQLALVSAETLVDFMIDYGRSNFNSDKLKSEELSLLTKAALIQRERLEEEQK